MFSITKLVLFFRLYSFAMSIANQDAAFIREVVQGAVVGNYIEYATLAILAYDIGEPSLAYANIPLTLK